MPLHAAAYGNGNPAVITLVLLQAGADINALDENGWSPLHLAAHNNKNHEVVLVLLSAGADASAKTNGGRTAFDLIQNNLALKDKPVFFILRDKANK